MYSLQNGECARSSFRFAGRPNPQLFDLGLRFANWPARRHSESSAPTFSLRPRANSMRKIKMQAAENFARALQKAATPIAENRET